MCHMPSYARGEGRSVHGACCCPHPVGGGGGGARWPAPAQLHFNLASARFSPRRFSVTPREWGSVSRRAVLNVNAVGLHCVSDCPSALVPQRAVQFFGGHSIYFSLVTFEFCFICVKPRTLSRAVRVCLSEKSEKNLFTRLSFV